MKTLYVSDMDGTLLGSDGRVSERTAALLSDAVAGGALVTVATARTPATAGPLTAACGLRLPAIVMTGAAMWHAAGRRFSDTRYFSSEDCRAAIDVCRSHGVYPFVYTMGADGRSLDVYHGAAALNHTEENFYIERKHLTFKRFHMGSTVPGAGYGRALICFAMGARAAVERAAEALRAETECSVFCYPDIFNPEIADLEVFAPGVSKAVAIERLKERVGAERLVVFGDNLNDLPMLAIADVAVAVGNAFPEVKAAADVIIEPNTADSVARFISEGR